MDELDEVIEAMIEARQSWLAVSRELVPGSRLREHIQKGNEDQQARQIIVISSNVKCIMHVISVHSRRQGLSARSDEDSCVTHITQS
jgi:hypothetical protein